MLARHPCSHRAEFGTTMLEVLVTIVILAFGMLGLAGLQSKIFVAEMESYQRGQAVVLLNSMIERINANRTVAASYVSANAFGTGDAQPATCPALPANPTPAQVAANDQCEWSNALKGAAETSGGTKVGGMIGAVGCVTQIQAEDQTPTLCRPGIYLVSVAWQGLNPTSIPSAACGQGTFGGDERLRRAISARLAIGLPSCQ
ncbi:MAG: type IV pilus modification protein PilV [Betaproteobacteria bacterium]|nr:MAG: type IV pilus modification protein PilV [Betaproteobacteria bacterium]